MLKELDKLASNINFKKVTKAYIVVSLLLLAVVFASSLYVFREKIVFSLNYLKIDRQVEKHGIDASIQSQLNALAGSMVDIKDVLLLDKDNNIVYSSKKSGIGKDNKLILTKVKGKNLFFQDVNIPDTYFKVVKPEKLLLTKDLYRNSREIKKEYSDDFFYNKNYNAEKIYFINYFTDRENGMKIFVINDIKPIPYAEDLIKSAAVLLLLIFGFYWILLALWVYKDASKKSLNAALWGLLILITNLVGVIVYVIYKQNNQTCDKCGSLQGKLNVFCSCCGVRVNESCEKCGAIISKQDNFCAGCGSKLNH